VLAAIGLCIGASGALVSPIEISSVAFGFMVALTDALVVVCVAPWFVIVTGKLNALPASL
jgi:hypothetical protein